MRESYLPLKERAPARDTTTKILFGYISDVFFVAMTICWLSETHWIPKAFGLTLPLALYAAGQIWRYRKHLATRWRKLALH